MWKVIALLPSLVSGLNHFSSSLSSAASRFRDGGRRQRGAAAEWEAVTTARAGRTLNVETDETRGSCRESSPLGVPPLRQPGSSGSQALRWWERGGGARARRAARCSVASHQAVCRPASVEPSSSSSGMTMPPKPLTWLRAFQQEQGRQCERDEKVPRSQGRRGGGRERRQRGR